MCTLLYLKWITHKDLLCSTGNSAQCYEPGCMGGEFGGVYTACICVAESLYCSPETVTTLLTNYIPVQLSHSVVSNSLQSHGLQHTGFAVHYQLPEPTQTHVHCIADAIQPSHPVVPFSSCLQSLPASGSFQMSQFFSSGGQCVGVSASTPVLPMNIQD